MPVSAACACNPAVPRGLCYTKLKNLSFDLAAALNEHCARRLGYGCFSGETNEEHHEEIRIDRLAGRAARWMRGHAHRGRRRPAAWNRPRARPPRRLQRPRALIEPIASGFPLSLPDACLKPDLPLHRVLASFFICCPDGFPGQPRAVRPDSRSEPAPGLAPPGVSR